MSRYPNDSRSSPNKQSPHGFDDRKRGSAHYPQFYDPVDHNGGQASPTRSAGGGAAEVSISQQGQHQQRTVPGGPSRPPVTNNAPLSRGAANGMTRPLSYSDPASEELSDNKIDAAKQRQQKRRGQRRADETGEEWDQAAAHSQSNSRPGPIPSSRSGSIPLSNQSLPTTRDRTNLPLRNGPESGMQEPPSPTKAKDSLSAGNTIPRLNSPSIMASVLQPLDKKVQEYDAQMNEAQNQMAQLDAEMAALQERRQEAESRYIAAKTKHDDYRRQYQGVERALRGEPEVFSRSSYEDERPMTQQTVQMPQSPRANSSRTESYSSLKKSKAGSRFRMSKLFGSD